MAALRFRKKQKPEAPEPSQPLPLKDIEPALLTELEGDDGDVVNAVDVAITQAAYHRASDLHFEPWEDCLALRYRIDGILHDIARLPKYDQEKIIARIKVLARMVVYQKDKPQDGSIPNDGTRCGQAMRVSTFPTIYGEKTVLRILGARHDLLALDQLGFRAEVIGALRELISRPQGTILLTGPSSSGKTTTIYGLLREMMATRVPSAHIVTIEDPVEYPLGTIAQAQVAPHAGFTFEAALRAMLRQDPEVIMVGEIRDPETARTAIQAGLTGHLVISTIHSGTAAGVFTRLLDMGVEPFLVASSVNGVLAQRLVRLNCPDCSAPYEPHEALLEHFGLADETDVHFAHGTGCPQCQDIGYHGRTAIGEMLTMNEELADLILSRPRTKTLHEAALRDHMVTLTKNGIEKARQGATTLEELRRVLPVA